MANFFICSKRFFSFLLVFLFIGTAGSLQAPANAAAPAGVAIALLPFKVNAARDMGYLRNGIRDMLATRLSANVGARIISNDLVTASLGRSHISDPGVAPAAALKELGRALGADYLVAGSLTALGSSMSLDARIIPMAGDSAPQTFYATAPTENDVLPAINHMAWDISEKVFGKARPGPAVTAGPTPGAAPAELSSFRTAHPDRAFMYPSASAAGTGSGIIRPVGISSRAGFSKSQNVAIRIKAMDVGDVDGDSVADIVMADEDQVYIYHRINNKLKEIGRVAIESNKYLIHGVSVADLNNNGRAEIYVSAADEKKPRSFGLEWNGQKFDHIFTRAPWYLRTLLLDDGRTILIGQQADQTSALSPGIYELQTGAKLQIVRKLRLPGTINLFDFALADLDQDGRAEIITIDQKDRLRVLEPGGRTLWKSDEYFGGTTRYIGEDREDNDTRPGGSNERIYLPSRIIVRDMNQDGRVDVIVNRNPETATRAFRNLKDYPSGTIYCLTWNGMGLSELWRTRKISGYIADYQLLADPDSPDRYELFIGAGIGGNWLDYLASGRSTILFYQLDVALDDKKP